MSKLRREDVMAAKVLQERGWAKRKIAKEFGVDESTIRYRLKRLKEEAPDGRRNQPEVCAKHAEVIEAWIEEQEGKERRRTAPVKALFEHLVEHEGYRGSYKAVLRYVRRRMKKPAVRPVRRVEVLPGTQAQIDWTEEKVWVHDLGGWVRLYAFIMVLSFSRMWAVVWSLRQDLLSWITCHNEAFERLEGVALTGRIDNLKTGVSKGSGPWAEIHPGYDSYSRQLGFQVNAARVRTPTDKGKVERRARDGHLLISGADRFTTLADLQAKTDERILRRSQERLCPLTGRSIYETWQEERQALCPLPPSLPTPFDVEVVREADPSCLVPFEGRRYQAPLTFRGKNVRGRGCAGTVEIRDWEGRLLKSYPRGTDCRLLLDQDLYDGEGDEDTCEALPELVERGVREEASLSSFLDLVLERERESREERRIRTSLKISGLPTGKTLDTFDFAFQRGVDRGRIEMLATCEFARRKENILLLGPPGVGKTHLAAGLGVRAVQNGFSVQFLSADELILRLRRDEAAENRRTCRRKYMNAGVLIIDELGFQALDRRDAHLLFRVVSYRYERGSTILTSNKSIREWPDVLANDEVLATALLDRLLHHCHVLNIDGRSFRLREMDLGLHQPTPPQKP